MSTTTAQALKAIHRHMATDSRDWGQDRGDAWLYGILVGWDCEEVHDHELEFCEGGHHHQGRPRPRLRPGARAPGGRVTDPRRGRLPGHAPPASQATPPVAALPDRACAGADPELFFPEGRGIASYDEARKLCHRCPHRQPCLEWALETGQGFGMWGATTPEERREMRRKRRTG